MTIDTRRLTERRRLSFASAEDVLAEIDRLCAASHDGRLRMLGNWTLAQMCDHLARLIGMGYGEVSVSAPWIVRVLGPMIVGRRWIERGFPSGMPLKGGAAALLPAEDPPLDASAACLRRALARISRNEPMTAVSPLLGRLSPEDWRQLQLRHCEHHLSYVVIE